MAVVEGHGGAGDHVGQQGLVLLGQGVVLGLVLLIGAAVLERAAVAGGEDARKSSSSSSTLLPAKAS